MHCKFLEHGIAISYDNLVKPCCDFKVDRQKTPNALEYDLSKYHGSDYIKGMVKELAQDQWPTGCSKCQWNEDKGRTSMRQNANQAYRDYSNTDITLEIRPGNVCNFACQTCWPAASSRVTAFYQKAGMDVTTPFHSIPGADQTKNIVDYSFLDTIKHRIKSVVLLGGEPFYDKNCLKFLSWAIDNLNANITLFTNTSIIRDDIINGYSGTFTIVSSMDAVGLPAEYIRFGTEWKTVEHNYKHLKTFDNVRSRVNITTSAYNFYYISDVIDFIINDWPEVVSFGPAIESKFKEWVVPLELRPEIIERLQGSINKIKNHTIPLDQQQNAVMNLQAIIDNLNQNVYNQKEHQLLKDFSSKLDTVKNLDSKQYGSYLSKLLHDQKD
jgi:organic radical activating enzyme